MPDKPSIAVLPFDNMSGDPEQEFFADNVVEAITATLSRIRSFFVIARNSAFLYKGKIEVIGTPDEIRFTPTIKPRAQLAVPGQPLTMIAASTRSATPLITIHPHEPGSASRCTMAAAI